MDNNNLHNSLRFLIVITGYNWKNYISACFRSVLDQTYSNYLVSVVDDGSDDGSLAEMIKLMPEGWACDYHTKNKGTIIARSLAINSIQKESYDIIVLLDGDDQLMPNALQILNDAYLSDTSILMTYGNYQFNTGKICPIDINYSDKVHQKRDYRNDIFRCTHLRSFKKELYFSVPSWEITESELKSYPDVELLFSMMEMSGQERIKVINEPIYIYNIDNPLATLKRFGKDNTGYLEITNRSKRDLLP